MHEGSKKYTVFLLENCVVLGHSRGGDVNWFDVV